MDPDAMVPPLILHVFSTFATGGPQVRFAAIVNHFGSRWRHAVVSMDGDLACRERLDPALQVQFPRIEFTKGDTFGNARRFRRMLKEMRPQALLTNNWGTIEWAIANKLPVVRHVHIEDGWGPDEAAGQIGRRVLMRRLVLRGRQVVLPSRRLWTMATKVWHLDPHWLRYVPNGIDLQQFASKRLDATNPSVIPVLGTVAALRPEKNLSRLLRAFALATHGVPGRLVIVGDGAERPALEALAQALGIADRVEFAGHVADPTARYAGFDAFAMSSDTEQMPISLLEAMASGLPVASTDVGDIRVMLPEVSQEFVTPLDDAKLGAAIRALLLLPDLRQRLGLANRAHAEQHFDQQDMFTAWASIMDGA